MKVVLYWDQPGWLVGLAGWVSLRVLLGINGFRLV